MFTLRSLIVVPAAAAVLTLGTAASGQVVLQDFTGNGNFDGTFGDFAATPGLTGITISSPTDDGGGFTGVGGGSLDLNESNSLFITARLNAGNTATNFRVILLEEDGAGTGEAFGYDVDTSLLNETTFTTVNLGTLATAFDIGPNVGFGRAAGDGLVNIDGGANEGLYEYQIQSGFTGQSNLQVEVANVFTNVPEPASLMLVGLGGLAMLGRRRSC